jgi:hypothetical protein
LTNDKVGENSVSPHQNLSEKGLLLVETHSFWRINGTLSRLLRPDGMMGRGDFSARALTLFSCSCRQTAIEQKIHDEKSRATSTVARTHSVLPIG